MALVDVLDIIPEGRQDLRRPVIDILKDLSVTLLKYQDAETGLWWQILDKAGAPGNYRESSSSSMFTYALCKGINNGYLPKDKYSAAVLKAYEGIVRDFVEVHADGTIDLTGCVIVGGLGYGRDGSYEYYMSEPIRDNDPKAVGPFIMAGLQVAELLEE
jgi:rhamnogalacturonyl hydrolase YesR